MERLRASKKTHVKTEHQSGAEVGEEWATQDPNYGELLRVARAVEEARREIDLDALRDLIDPEH